MANRERGEVSVDIDGTSYTLCLDLNAMCTLEEYFSTPDREVTFQDVLKKVNGGNLRYMRAIFWAAFLKYQPDLKLEDVAALVQASGGIGGFSQKMLGQLGVAVQATAPAPADLRALQKGSAPSPRAAQARKPVDGTGMASTARRVG